MRKYSKAGFRSSPIGLFAKTVPSLNVGKYWTSEAESVGKSAFQEAIVRNFSVLRRTFLIMNAIFIKAGKLEKARNRIVGLKDLWTKLRSV